jgi:hypothetical protein
MDRVLVAVTPAVVWFTDAASSDRLGSLAGEVANSR